MKILLAEDEESLARGLKYLLEKQHYLVDIAGDGEEALELIDCVEYDALVLDIMMPYKSGMNVLREVRRRNSSVPIMMLTAKAQISDRVAGLEAGADDYLPKPFATQEFLARVKTLMRRRTAYTENFVSYGNVRLDCGRYELSGNDICEKLSNKEFQLLEMFIRNPGVVFSTERLLKNAWGLDTETGIGAVWVYIGFIRKKLNNIHADIEIRTIRGAGYSLQRMDS